MTGAGWSGLAELPRLRRVSIRSGSLNDEGLVQLALSGSLEQITIDDGERRASGVTDRGILALSRCPT